MIPRMTLRHRVHEVLRSIRPDDRLSRVVGLGLMVLIVGNILVMLLESTESAAEPADLPPFYGWFEGISVLVFSVEYLLRLWSAKEQERYQGRFGRLRWIGSPMAVIDLLAVLPFYLALFGGLGLDLRMLRVLRLFRLLRLLKLGRYSAAMHNVGWALRARRAELLFSLGIIVALLLIASSLMYHVEHDRQPEAFRSIPAAMWWGIATLTTVGYGDVVPLTATGRVLGAVIAILGIGIFALPAGILAGALNEAVTMRRKGAPCPHCAGTGVLPEA